LSELEPTRCMIIHKNGLKEITNNVRLFGNPEFILSSFRFLMPDKTLSEEEFWFDGMIRDSAIYYER
jgi:hypothetical protein